MARRRVIIDFSNFTEEGLSTVTHTITTMLTTNALTFPALPINVLTLAAHLSTYDGILTAPIYPGQADDLAAARQVLETDLRDNGIYINVTGNGDATILNKSGYPLAKEPEAHGPLLQTNMLIESLPGAFNIEITPVDEIAGRNTIPGARAYLVLYVDLDDGVPVPADFKDWTWAYFPKHTGQLSGLKRATQYRLVSVGLGTSLTLVYSDPIDRVTQ